MRRFRVSPSLVLALVAVVLSVTGTAVAAKLITGKQIKDGSISSKDLSKAVRDQLSKAASPGAPGVKGERGDAGAKGEQGAPGAQGPGAVRLQGFLPRPSSIDPSSTIPLGKVKSLTVSLRCYYNSAGGTTYLRLTSDAQAQFIGTAGFTGAPAAVQQIALAPGTPVDISYYSWAGGADGSSGSFVHGTYVAGTEVLVLDGYITGKADGCDASGALTPTG
jgi:hypothetical protein